jgi:hypothetical protein
MMTGPWRKFLRIAQRAGLSKTDMSSVLWVSRRSVQLWIQNGTAPSYKYLRVINRATGMLDDLIHIKELPTLHSAVRANIITKVANECRHGTMAPRV